MKIGIRREDKNIWERRVPLTPEDARSLKAAGIDLVVQSSRQRIFSDAEYAAAGIGVQADLETCDLIMGVKEIPLGLVEYDKTYVCFAHVIKGQAHNMPLLKRMIDRRATLFDYERIVDEQNRRLIFFGRHAGLAGMLNSLWALGQRLKTEGIRNPFEHLRQMRTYASLSEARQALTQIAGEIREKGIPDAVHPLTIGITGYGNVAGGAREILDLLPVKMLRVRDLGQGLLQACGSRRHLYGVVFREEHCVVPKSPGSTFDLQAYYRRGHQKYTGCFARYLPHLTVLVNCIYWDSRYPRLVSLKACRNLWPQPGAQPKLRVIGDITCDVKGSIECNVKATDPGNPVYVYAPLSGAITDGFIGSGPVVMAVDILPAEIPREASLHFSRVLKPLIPALAHADFQAPSDAPGLPAQLKRAMILQRGKLAPDYTYLKKFL